MALEARAPTNIPNVTIRCLPNPDTLSQFSSTSLYIPQPTSYSFADLFDDLALGFRNISEDKTTNSFASAIALGRFESERSAFTVITREDPSTLALSVTPGIYYIFRHEQRLCTLNGAGPWHRIPQHPPALAGEAHCCRHVALLAKGGKSASIIVSDYDYERTQRPPMKICTNFPNLGVLPDIDMADYHASEADSRNNAFLSAIRLRDRVCLLTGESDFEAANIVPFHGEDQWTSEMQNAAWMERNRSGFVQTHEYGPEEITSFCVENGFAVRKDLRRDFDRFRWSVNPRTFRIRVFAAYSHLLPFHNQLIFRPHSSLSPPSPSAFPPSPVWEWHYNQCILRSLHNRNAHYIYPTPTGTHDWHMGSAFDDSDSAIANDDSSDEEDEDCLCFSDTASSVFGNVPDLQQTHNPQCPHHGNLGMTIPRPSFSVSSTFSTGASTNDTPASSVYELAFTSKRVITWDSTSSDNMSEQAELNESLKRTRTNLEFAGLHPYDTYSAKEKKD